MRLRYLLVLLCAFVVASSVWSWPAASAQTQAPESIRIVLYPDEPYVYINGVKTSTETPLIETDETFYLPAAELPRWFGVHLNWDEAKEAVQLTTPRAFLEYRFGERQVYVNGTGQSWEKASLMRGDRLYLDIGWLSQYISYHWRVDRELNRVELQYVRSGEGGMFRNDALPNVKPVAKFTVDKEYYRIGEPIRYIDLSYDPKGGELAGVEWTGNAEAIFTPGLYKVSLRVTDSRGNASDTYSRNILVKDEPYLDEFEYNVHHRPVGSYIRQEEAVLRQRLRGLPQLSPTVRYDKERPLIVSDSPEIFTEKGILYQERVNGKARFYATHLNGTDKKMKFAIVAKNLNGSRPVRITTTNRGEVYPSIYANVIGNEATIEFLQNEAKPETMTLGPLETAYYKVMPEFYPEQGMNVIYDVETDGDVYFYFVAMEQEDTLDSIKTYPRLPYSGNVRGTFDSSDVTWNVDLSDLSEPSSFAIGDGVQDRFVTGDDYFTKEPSLNLGNYGVVYNIRIANPPKMSVLVLARGGVFKGPFRINGKIVQTPPSGVMIDYQGYTIITRTDGTEEALDIEFSPASGSAFPIDVIFYPDTTE